MKQYKSINILKDEVKAGKILIIDAIEVLQEQFNYSSKDAEQLVDNWIENA